MDARIEPLSGKYYGTIVSFDVPMYGEASVQVWVPHGEPSERELSGWGLTKEDWDKNSQVDDGWGGTTGCRAEICCDGHYESALSLRIAEALCEALKDVEP